MRIALVSETFLPRVDGIVRMLLEFIDYLQERGHEALVYAPGAGPAAYQGVEVVRVRGISFPLYPELVLSPYSRSMRPALRDWLPDLVHLASPFVLGAYGLRVARDLGVPVAAHYQTDLARFARHYGLGAFSELAWRRLLAIHNACDINFAPTASIAAELRGRGMSDVEVVGRGVDTITFHPRKRDLAWRERLTGGNDRPVLAYVGRVAPEKGLATLVAVAEALPDCVLLVVGDGPARAGFAEAFAGRDVVFTGLLHGEQLAAAYALADLFVFPSETETFGQVVREAMASGLPVVGVRAGGVQDLVQPEVTGLLAEPGDVEGFVAATRRLVAAAELRRAMGLAARRQAESCTWAAVFDRLLDFYRGVTNHKQVARA